MNELMDYGADRCLECGSCTDVCTSARHGGIIPEEAVRAVSEGRPAEKIWKCLQCHRCSAACPEGIDVAGLICHLRNEASSSGDIPERFRRSAAQMKKDLRMYPIIGRTAAQRSDLGLSTGEISDDERAKVSAMLKGAGFDD